MKLTDKNNHFELFSSHDYARFGQLKTRVGLVTTPTFMPDGTRGAVKSLTPEQVMSTGVGVVLANTYHLNLQPGAETVATLGGLHKFTRQALPILTDSGGFQVFSLAHVSKISEEGVAFKDPVSGDSAFLSPEISIQIQMKLGADMMVAFDDVTSLDEQGRTRTEEALERTHRWLHRSLAEFQRLTKDMPVNSRPLLFGVVQGGIDKKLRKRSLDMVQSLPVDGVAIGGLSVGEPRHEMHEILAYLCPLYDKNRPRFLLGVGDPVDLRFAIEHGIDMLDCVLPTRNARHATAWVGNNKKIHLTNEKYKLDPEVLDPGCDCTTCRIPHNPCYNEPNQPTAKPVNSNLIARGSSGSCPRCGEALSGYSKGFLRHQFKVGETLAGTLVSIHNIRYLQRICEEYQKYKNT